METLQNTAWTCTDLGQYRKAVVILRKAIGIAARGCVPIANRLALWNQIGINYKYLGDYAVALRWYRLALRYSANLPLLERNSVRANLYHNLGGLEHAQQRYARGEGYARKSVRYRKRVDRSGSLALAADQVALAAILDGRHKFRESRKLYAASLKTYKKVYGRSHPEIALVLNNLGAVCHAIKRHRQAEALYKAALTMKRHELGRNHPELAVTLNNLGKLYQATGKSRDARRHLKEAIRILVQALGKSHPATKLVKANLTKLMPV